MSKSNAIIAPPLADERVLLRPYLRSDAEDLCEAAVESAVEVGRWLPWCRLDYSIEDSLHWFACCAESWEAGKQFHFAVLDRPSGRFVGGCGLHDVEVDPPRAELGYWIRTTMTGRGFASSATRLLARFGFDVLGLERIEIAVALGNHGSQRVAVKAGAVQARIDLQRLRIGDRLHDAAVFMLHSPATARSAEQGRRCH